MSRAREQGRIERRFAELARAERGGLIPFVMAGDPDLETCSEILAGLPEAGADLIELGVPFTDPMADGPSIQAAGQRAFAAGITLPKALELVRRFRAGDDETPLVLMGYYNPIYRYGVPAFVAAAREAGVDGLIVVDLPPEEDEELCLPAIEGGLRFIRLATPTTDDRRLPRVLTNTGGFVYYVSITGITGAKAGEIDVVGAAVARLRRHTPLPIAIGFGIKTPEQAAAVARVADAVVVGSAIVDEVGAALAEPGGDDARTRVLRFINALADGVRQARTGERRRSAGQV